MGLASIFYSRGLLTFVLLFISDTETCYISYTTKICNGNTSNVSVSALSTAHNGITTLTIANTNLSELQEGNISLPFFPRLTTLHLYSNGIRVFSNYIISNNIAIKTLSLQANKLKVIPVDALKHLPNLTYLDLSRNEITRTESFVFHWNTLLEYLYLKGNGIHDIQRHAFFSLVNVKILILSKNFINYIPLEELKSLRRLETLNLSHNNISMLLKANGGFSLSLQFLYLTQNKLRFIAGHALNVPRGLILLDAERNHISQISSLAFGNDSINLISLNLNHNELVTIPVFLLRRLPKLKSFGIAWNRVTVVPTEAFKGNSLLKYINLGWNRIHFVHEMSLTGLQSLQHLDLRFNNISSLPSRLFNPVGDFSLLLGGNNFSCNCEIRFLQEWLRKTIFFAEDLFCLIAGFENHTNLISFEFSDICVDETTSVEVSTDVMMTRTPSKPLSILRNWKVAAGVFTVSVGLLFVVVLKAIPKKLERKSTENRTPGGRHETSDAQ
ncbi:Leucine-rich repeats and immunoglobulin-like domains protein 3 [Holothuria leucospilota]|uniref:Leucine-rich repeats and immunoglobulin-like domains protein 3 n=1 Tax=Holothuria leucospilota TaxID=206669 RepID=A0A9Q1HDP9_HOLLE|nr:Leucine-rich repeats and immunoglobulin-like domains protein 3 [Holothuria leucospilota]